MRGEPSSFDSLPALALVGEIGTGPHRGWSGGRESTLARRLNRKRLGRVVFEPDHATRQPGVPRGGNGLRPRPCRVFADDLRCAHSVRRCRAGRFPDSARRFLLWRCIRRYQNRRKRPITWSMHPRRVTQRSADCLHDRLVPRAQPPWHERWQAHRRFEHAGGTDAHAGCQRRATPMRRRRPGRRRSPDRRQRQLRPACNCRRAATGSTNGNTAALWRGRLTPGLSTRRKPDGHLLQPDPCASASAQ
jgi:hypothetical protein